MVVSKRSQLAVIASAASVLALAAPAMASASNAHKVVTAAPSWTASLRTTRAPVASARMDVYVVLALRDPAGAESLAASVSNPGSASYRHFVTAAQWRQRFAPTSEQAAQVSNWLRANGFSIDEVPSNNRYIRASARTSDIEKAFGTRLGTFRRNGQAVTAPTTALSVPADLAAVVAGIGGLDTSAMAHPMNAGVERTQARGSGDPVPPGQLPPPEPVFRNSGPCSTYFGEKTATSVINWQGTKRPYAPCGYKPAQLRGAYGVGTGAGSGKGARIAITDAFAAPYIKADAQAYARKNDPGHLWRPGQLTQVLPKSYHYIDECGGAGWYGEETLDVESAHALAPDANVVYVGGRSCMDADLDAAIDKVVNGELADMVSNSWGETESDGSAVADMTHQTALQAAAQGISLLVSSGDNGDEIANTGRRQADAPANDPLFTAVGGTSLGVNKTNGYGFEQGWGTGKSVLTDGKWDPMPPAWVYGAGGGTSRLFTQPAYQKGVVPDTIAHYFGTAKAMRAVPDIALDGDPQTGFLMGMTQTFPDGSLRYSQYRIGGTSLSSPLMAGVTADAISLSGGAKLGFLNPAIYAMAGSSAVRDVNHGRTVDTAVVRVDYINGFDAADGLRTSLRTFNQTGTIYTRPGYDDVTGVGTPAGTAFLRALSR